MDNLDLWIERYSEILGCDPVPACVAAEMEFLKREVDRARKTIAHLRSKKSTTIDPIDEVLNERRDGWLV